MKVSRWNREFLPSYFASVGPDGSGSGSSDSGSGGSAPSAPSSSGTSPAAPPSGSTSETKATPAAAPSAATSSSSPVAPLSGASPTTSTPSQPDGGATPLDFEAIFGGPPEDVASPIPPQPTTPTPPQPPTAEPSKPAPAAAEAPAAAAPPAPATPAAASATSSGLPPLNPLDPSSIVAHLEANRDAAVTHFAENLFKLSPEDVEALESDTVGTIPKLLGRAYYEMQRATLGQMARLVPAMVGQHQQAMQRNAVAEDAFYAKWPQIDKSKHGELVRRYAVTYRSMHPQATRDQMFEDLGPLVMMAAKIPMGAPAPRAAAPSSPKPTPFVPAGGGQGGTGTGAELSPVEAMFAHRDD